jgi:hypothetical protein
VLACGVASLVVRVVEVSANRLPDALRRLADAVAEPTSHLFLGACLLGGLLHTPRVRKPVPWIPAILGLVLHAALHARASTAPGNVGIAEAALDAWLTLLGAAALLAPLPRRFRLPTASTVAVAAGLGIAIGFAFERAVEGFLVRGLGLEVAGGTTPWFSGLGAAGVGLATTRRNGFTLLLPWLLATLRVQPWADVARAALIVIAVASSEKD